MAVEAIANKPWDLGITRRMALSWFLGSQEENYCVAYLFTPVCSMLQMQTCLQYPSKKALWIFLTGAMGISNQDLMHQWSHEYRYQWNFQKNDLNANHMAHTYTPGFYGCTGGNVSQAQKSNSFDEPKCPELQFCRDNGEVTTPKQVMIREWYGNLILIVWVFF